MFVDNIPLSVDSSVEIAVRTYEFDQFVQNCGWFYLFCLYWTSEWLVAVGDMIVAVAISKWYFTRDKSELSGTATVTASILTTLAHHMGSCAYGALIIAIVKMIRSVIAKIQKEVAKMDSKIGMNPTIGFRIDSQRFSYPALIWVNHRQDFFRRIDKRKEDTIAITLG